MKHNERSVVVLRVLGVNVDVANGALENADLGTVAAGFENQSFILYADDLADNAADGRDLVAHLQSISHGSSFLFLLFLGTDHQEVEYCEHDNEHDDGHQSAAAVGCTGSCI